MKTKINKVVEIDTSTIEGKVLICIITELKGHYPYCGKDLDELIKMFSDKTPGYYPELLIE